MKNLNVISRDHADRRECGFGNRPIRVHPISGPLSLVLDSLSRNAMLINKTGVTANFPPLGSPFVDVMIGADNMLNPGESVSVALEFAKRRAGRDITYSTRVLTGDLPP